MMLIERITEDCLFEYAKIILRFEKALVDTYRLGDNPYQCQRLFPSAGTVMSDNEVFEYRFHGRGCSFNYADLEVHYDYNIPEEDYIMTVPWKFWRFADTFLTKNREVTIPIDQIADMLEKLNEKGVIQKVHPDFLQYQIGFSWYETYVPLKEYG